MIKRYGFLIWSLVVLSVAPLYLLLWSRQEPKLKAPFISFTASMKKGDPDFGKNKGSKETQRQWELFKNLYNTHLSLAPAPATRIPKIIHQIWLGGPLPEKYHAFQKSWQEHHPDWKYRLWTDADLPTFNFSDRVRFEKAENKGEASDILRYEILYQFGGLYVDTDFECLKPHDILHHYCDFYVGLMADPPGKKRRPEIINSIIGSVPGHPIFKHCLAEISQRETGGQASQILEVTGPKCLTRAFLKLCKEGSYRNVVFPFTYFYPWPNTLRHDPASKEQWIQEETFSVHCWHVSWLKPKQ